jgi:hypothetical protein
VAITAHNGALSSSVQLRVLPAVAGAVLGRR